MPRSRLLVETALLAWVVVAERPHIVFVMVDDWGWNNVGYHRPNSSEVQTPNIDGLVREGIELDRHYTYHYCSPSRSSLQSGRLPVHVDYRGEGTDFANPSDPDSGFMGIPRNMTGIAEKMRSAGYRTHATGKWDAGMATWQHTPMGRGYETWFGYYNHANDYRTQRLSSSGGSSSCKGLVDLWNTSGPARDRNGTGYEEEMFTENTLGVLDRHNPSEPLFLYHAFHQIHTPLQVPTVWESKFCFLLNPDRRKYAAMVHYMDTALGKIVAKLQSKGMWSNTLMVVSSDNGGPTYMTPDGTFGGASNRPLRGSKLSDWEGGVRVNAFVTGGAVPPAKRGSKLKDYIHMADWYATFTSIAGVDATDKRAAAAGLPPVDGIDHSALLLGDAALGTGKRTEIHHSVRALMRGRWKLITGGNMDGMWSNPMGNGTIGFASYGDGWGIQALMNDLALMDCSAGCLYDIWADPIEAFNVAEQQPDVLKEMRARLDMLNQGVFLPDRGTPDPRACTRWNGFFGPFIDDVPDTPALELLV